MSQKHGVSDHQPALGQQHSNAACSAFSKLARPGEDWTKLSDLEVRRRVQNRIAQRNYRVSSSNGYVKIFIQCADAKSL